MPHTPSCADTLPTTRPRRASGSPIAIAGYDIGAVIGRGGMGEVIAAVEHKLDREVAIKQLHDAGEGSDAVVRFLREARIQARLDHPAIVPVYDLGEDADRRPFFTMKRLAGVTLHQRLAARGPIQPMLRALVDVCFAIELAHTRGVVHRDLKPSNIMLGSYGEVHVLDWGVARVIGTSRISSAALPVDAPSTETQTGALLGTPGYMAPEQVRGEHVDGSADVYALGAILFEILAGEPLHPRGSEALASTLRGVTQSVAQRSPDRTIPPELDALCAAALRDDPRLRPTARELAESIEHYLDGDRDLEHRRKLAQEFLARATTLLASADPSRRGGALRAAGRALAFDPGSTAAADLVTTLLVEPPDKFPPELVAALDDAERGRNRELSSRAIKLYFAVFAWVLFLPFIHVSSWPLVGAMFVAAISLAAVAWRNGRVGTVPALAVLGPNLVLVLLFSRFASALMLVPVIVTGIAFRAANREAVSARPWLVVLWAVTAMLLPFGLEAIGALAHTWSIEDGALVLRGTVTQIRGTGDMLALMITNVGLVAIIVSYAVRVHHTSRAVRRELFVQAWHLRHLLPGDARS